MNNPIFTPSQRALKLISSAGCVLLLVGCSTSQFSKIEPTSSRWEAAIQEFEVTDQATPAPENGILFIGSSSIRMWKTLDTDFPSLPTINRGFGGSQIVDSLHYAPRIIFPYNPSKIFLYAGDNDVAKGKSATVVLRDYKRFVKAVRKTLPETEIHFIAIKPSTKRWHLAEEMMEANERIRNYSGRHPKLHYVDIWTPMLNQAGEPMAHLFLDDGLHMNRSGYEIWIKAVAPFL